MTGGPWPRRSKAIRVPSADVTKLVIGCSSGCRTDRRRSADSSVAAASRRAPRGVRFGAPPCRQATGRRDTARAREDRGVIVDRDLVHRLETSAARVSAATVAAFVARDARRPGPGAAVGRRGDRRLRAGPLRQPGGRRHARRHRRHRARRDRGLLRRRRRRPVDRGRLVVPAGAARPARAAWLHRHRGSATSTPWRWTRPCRPRTPTSACARSSTPPSPSGSSCWPSATRSSARRIGSSATSTPVRCTPSAGRRTSSPISTAPRSAAARWSATTASAGSAGRPRRPAGRRRGVQTTLLRHRMAVAARDGCDIVAATARPPGDSARNLSRLGFTLAYAQVVMTCHR